MRSLLSRLRRRDAVAVGLVLTVGLLVLFVATDLFRYHSVNDDEGVYLLQAAMLLEGQLFLHPPSELAELVRPWFFVVDSTAESVRMYPKYAPVPAAMFALGLVVGEPRVALAGIAAGSALFVYLLARALFDRSVGVVAVVLLASAPLFILTSSVFLPYAATTFWNLAFAVAYVRAVRRDSTGYALAAGVAVGVAFFARPYTAVLFAAPFIVHACWQLWAGVRRQTNRAAVVRRTTAIVVPGLCFVGATLGYNALLTGAATTFPYEAFAPRDGLGFGRRSILGYTEQYTPALAATATVEALRLFTTRFAPLGALGTAFAAVGVAAVAMDRTAGDIDHEFALVVLGLVPSVILGNVYFWGTLNGLRNGLIDLLGPFYHFDLLVPVSLFGAVGVVTLWRRLRDLLSPHLSPRGLRIALVLALVVSAPVVVGVERAALAEPWTENRQRTENLAVTYEPFDGFEEGLDDEALVYIPEPYGDWQQHPFQYLRNDPNFDGPALFVLDEGPDSDIRALDATDRTPYRFTYRGEWTGAVRPVEPQLTRLRLLDGETVTATSTFGAPSGATAVSIRVETEAGFSRYRVENVGEDVPTVWQFTPDGVEVMNHQRTSGPRQLPIPAGASEVDLVVRFATTGGSSITYRQEVTVSRSANHVRVLWPPETRVCRLRPECGTEGTWVGPDGDYLDGVSVEMDAAVTAS